MASPKIKNNILKTFLAPWYMEITETAKILKFYGNQGFCFLNREF